MKCFFFVCVFRFGCSLFFSGPLWRSIYCLTISTSSVVFTALHFLRAVRTKYKRTPKNRTKILHCFTIVQQTILNRVSKCFQNRIMHVQFIMWFVFIFMFVWLFLLSISPFYCFFFFGLFFLDRHVWHFDVLFSIYPYINIYIDFSIKFEANSMLAL